MQFQLNATPFIFGILILALVGAVLGFAAPEILKATNVQNQMRIQQAKADAEIAEEQARALVAPTIAAKEVELKLLEVLSKTNEIKFATDMNNAELDARKRLADAQSDAVVVSANSDYERNRFFGIGILSLLACSGVALLGTVAGKAWLKQREEQHQFLLTQGGQEIRKQEIEILNKAVDVLSKSGGEMVLENGRVLRFQPTQPPLMLQVPVQEKVMEDAK